MTEKKLKVSEIFASIQGEGCNAGKAVVFVRFYGCNMHCDFCDTKYSWEKPPKTNDKRFSFLSPATIISKAKEAANGLIRTVCFTGGEPLIQDINPLFYRFKKERWKVWLETNASISKPIIKKFDWVAASPKAKRCFWTLMRADEIKLVVWDDDTIDYGKALAKRFPDKPFWLQPRDNDPEVMKLIVDRLLMTSQPNNLRCGFQLHKIAKIK